MQIAGMEAFILRWPEPNDFDHERMTVLLRVDTNAGVTGWGEAIAMWPEACRATVAIIEDGFAPLLAGRDPRDVEALLAGDEGAQLVVRRRRHRRARHLRHRHGALGHRRQGCRRAALPRCSAARSTRRCRPAPACMSTSRRSRRPSRPSGYIDGGFRSAKLGLGKRGLSRAGRDPDYDVELVGALRQAIGPGPDIMVDAGNGVRWDVDTAIRTTRRMEAFGIKWIEEPLHPSNVAGHQELKARTRNPDRRRGARMGPGRLSPLDRKRRGRRLRHRSGAGRRRHRLPGDRRARSTRPAKSSTPMPGARRC